VQDNDAYEIFKGIAIEVFKSRSLKAIQSLKDFLTALPSPTAIRTVLLDSVYQLVEHDSEAYDWILTHHRALEPELNLIRIAQKIVTEQLQPHGLVLNQDFCFGENGQLQASRSIRALLLENVSERDRLLLTKVLSFGYSPDGCECSNCQ